MPCKKTKPDSKTEVYTVFSGRRVVFSFRCSEELKKAFIPVAKQYFGSVCRPFEAMMATILTAVNENVNFGHTVKIEKLVVERNLRPRRYAGASRDPRYMPEANMYDPKLLDWVYVEDAVLNDQGHAVGCGCSVCRPQEVRRRLR